MEHDILITLKECPAKNEREYVTKRFVDFNNRQSGVFPYKELNIFAYSPQNEIIGGLLGDISWGWLHVDVLWVEEAHRKSGIGTVLMDRAETEAIEMKVNRAYLETTDFQATDFYKKRGYHIFAQLEDQPPGHICYYMRNDDLYAKGRLS